MAGNRIQEQEVSEVYICLGNLKTCGIDLSILCPYLTGLIKYETRHINTIQICKIAIKAISVAISNGGCLQRKVTVHASYPVE